MRRHVIAAVVGTVLSAALALAVSSAPGASAGERDGRTEAERVRAEHQRIVDYWTPERRASAVPRNLSPLPLPLAKGGGRPGGGGGGADDTSTVMGAAWNGHENIRRTTGKVFFTLGSTRYVCSGSAVAAPAGRSIVSTAGHCVHEGDGGEFATNWIFYPRWNGAADPELGEWTATSLSTTTLWARTANGFDDDAGFALVTNGKTDRTLAQVITEAGGSVQKIAFTSPLDEVYTALGYPAAKKYKGNTLIYCRGPVSSTRDSHDTLAMDCDMTGGSSGGPWLHTIDASGVGTQASLNSYGYTSLANVMFGPIFDEDEEAAYDAAALGSCQDGIVSGDNCVIDRAAAA